jgi:very-short-patch-repair endonuclease
VVEVDGPPHGRPASLRDDARKDEKLGEAGNTVLRFSDREVQSGACVQRVLQG